MTIVEAKLLLKSLLERIRADPTTHRGLFSQTDQDALEIILDTLRDRQDVLADADVDSHEAPSPVTPVTAAATSPTEPPADIVLCLDFGTAKSKAFASRSGDGEEYAPLDLAIGTLDGDVDDSVFCAGSSIWIDKDGRIYFGSTAVRHGSDCTDTHRERVDSLKHFVSQAESAEQVRTSVLTRAEDPTMSGLTQEDALVLYLGYLTDLALIELARHGLPRTVRRRFAMPCWSKEQQRWAAPYLARLVARAQIVADTFSGHWTDGLRIDDVKVALRASDENASQLEYLIACDLEAAEGLPQRSGGVLEPIASASARVWTDSDRLERQLTLVVDIGAGTTDLGIFWVVQDGPLKRAFPIVDSTAAIRIAGDHLDAILQELLLDRGHIDGRLRDRAAARLRLDGLRRLKERLFKDGSLTHRLLNDSTVTVTTDEFVGTRDVQAFKTSLEDTVRQVIDALHSSWQVHAGRINLVLTGGGSNLPMTRDLVNLAVQVGDQQARFRLSPLEPPDLPPKFRADYPQLAVAMGGCMKLLEGRSPLSEFGGSHTPPGRLERFQSRGL